MLRFHPFGGSISKADAAWNNPYLVWTLLAIAGAFCIYWHLRIPSPGKAVTVMAVVAAVMALRGEMGGFEKFAWLTLLFLFLVIEIRAIDKDREAHEQKFKRTIDGFTETISGITGGQTFPYLEAPGEQVPLGVVSLCKD